MQKLVRGVHDFQRNVFRSHEEFFSRLARGQSPEALFVSCSDSRINPILSFFDVRIQSESEANGSQRQAA